MARDARKAHGGDPGRVRIRVFFAIDAPHPPLAKHLLQIPASLNSSAFSSPLYPGSSRWHASCSHFPSHPVSSPHTLSPGGSSGLRLPGKQCPLCWGAGELPVFLWEMTLPLLPHPGAVPMDKDGLLTLARAGAGVLRVNSRLKLELFGREASCLRGKLLGAERVEACGERSGPPPCSAPAWVESQCRRAEERSRHTSLCPWIQPCLKQDLDLSVSKTICKPPPPPPPFVNS